MSLGDFVLTGGESACMVMCDCILRLLPGVIKQDSSDDDSFSNGLLEYPQYTKPEIYDGKSPRCTFKRSSCEYKKISS